jgi:hypothetical protein
MPPKAACPPASDAKPDANPDQKDDLKTLPLPEVEKRLGSSPDGLTQFDSHAPSLSTRCTKILEGESEA